MRQYNAYAFSQYFNVKLPYEEIFVKPEGSSVMHKGGVAQ